jgi:hypothetical protein
MLCHWYGCLLGVLVVVCTICLAMMAKYVTTTREWLIRFICWLLWEACHAKVALTNCLLNLSWISLWVLQKFMSSFVWRQRNGHVDVRHEQTCYAACMHRVVGWHMQILCKVILTILCILCYEVLGCVVVLGHWGHWQFTNFSWGSPFLWSWRSFCAPLVRLWASILESCIRARSYGGEVICLVFEFAR